MKPKKYRVLNTHDYKSQNKIVHEYDIVVDMNEEGIEVITLYRSHDETWSENIRGEEIVSLIDTGEMMIFPKKTFAGDVGYDKFAELFVLLSFLNKTYSMSLYKGTIEEVTDIKTYEI